ncbi:MAG: hypothetical protein CMA27_04895 [Euryarchaeota archaeon]|nr:hypothetical protein [Euryarchaeota archaeon]|tara:strand:+ start:2496 stop:3371 length:876 start_codon:yes stop_codon:yes gene_type:complete
MNSKILVVYKKNYEDVHDIALNQMIKCLNKLENEKGIKTDYKARERVQKQDFVKRKLIIVLGGDGTLTSISHNILDETPVMGVNSNPRDIDPSGSVGFYLDSNMSTFSEDISNALENKFIINSMPRLQAIISTPSGNIMKSDPALNDLLIANSQQYMPSKYILKRGDIEDEQHSSGLLFSTFFGQGAWFRHICNIEGMKFDMKDINQNYLVVARDLNRDLRKIIPNAYMDWTSDETTIISNMHRGYVVPDGWNELQFIRGANISVNLKAPPLNLITFRNSMISKLEHLVNK